MRKTFVNIGRQVMEKKNRPSRNRFEFSAGTIKAVKVFLILAVVAAVNVLSYSLFSATQPELAKIKKVSGPNAEKSVELSRKIFAAFNDNGNPGEFARFTTGLDFHTVMDCKSYLGKLNAADFGNASVFSPVKDAGHLYVYVPTVGGERVQFVFRDVNNALSLEWVCLNGR